MVSSPYKLITFLFILFVTTLFSMPNEGGVENPSFNPMTEEGVKNLLFLYEKDKNKLSTIIKDQLILGLEIDINKCTLKLSEDLWPLDIAIPKNKLWLYGYYIRKAKYLFESIDTLITDIEKSSRYFETKDKKIYYDSLSKKVSELKEYRIYLKNYSDKEKISSFIATPAHSTHNKMECIINDLKNQIDEVNKNKLPDLITVVTLLIQSHSITDTETAL
jgi:hypothetical protein